VVLWCDSIHRSAATLLNVVYNLSATTSSLGTSVALLSGSGHRTFTNRFGSSFTTPLTLSTSTPQLVYLNTSAVLDTTGLTLNLASPIQLAGSGPNALYSSLNVYYTPMNGIVESGSSLIDGLGVALLTSITGVNNLSIGASNANSLAINNVQCQAPILFTNGLRPPTQPSSSNGGTHIAYTYTISDGVTYSVQASLNITTTSAFATTTDLLGSPYQAVTSITGSRLYTYIPTGATLSSAITGISNTTPNQRFYPYALLSSAPGVYSINTAPFLDEMGLSFTVSPAIPANGQPVGVGSGTYTTATVFIDSTGMTAVLIEAPTSTSPPLASLQRQSYTIL
jgi:hypothetical protein